VRSRASILEELRDLDDALTAFGGEQLGDSGAALMRESLLVRRDELGGLLAAALLGQHRPAIRLFLDGQPVSGMTIVASVLGKALDELQGSIHALGAAIAGRTGERGILASRIVGETQFVVTGFIPGSFGVTLEAPLGPVQQSMFTDEPDLSLAERATDRLLNVLEIGSRADTNEPLVEELGGLGARPVNRLKEFAKHISDSEATVRLEWLSPEVAERAVEMDRVQVHRLASHLASVEATESHQILQGWLGGASKIRGRFELQSEDGKLYQGTAAPDVIDELERYFNRRCIADVIVTVTRSTTTGKELERFYLVDLTLAAQP
jgi:hypothetical protein